MRECRNSSCPQPAVAVSVAGAAIVRAKESPRSSWMSRQMLPISSAVEGTACVSYEVLDSDYISLWLVPAVP